jgi:hypothetical protein
VVKRPRTERSHSTSAFRSMSPSPFRDRSRSRRRDLPRNTDYSRIRIGPYASVGHESVPCSDDDGGSRHRGDSELHRPGKRRLLSGRHHRRHGADLAQHHREPFSSSFCPAAEHGTNGLHRNHWTVSAAAIAKVRRRRGQKIASPHRRRTTPEHNGFLRLARR